MAKPVRPVAPARALRSDPATFSANAEGEITYQFAALPNWMDALGDFVDDRADDALAAALGGDLPPITGKGGQFLRVNAGETAAEFAPFDPTKATEAQAEAGTGTGLMDPVLTKAAIDAQVPVLAMPKIATWTHSTNVNEVYFIDLGDWDQIEIECVGLLMDSQIGVELRVSFNNGSTYQTSGYASFVFDSTGDLIKGSGLSLSRGASDLQCAIYRLSSMASAGRSVGNGTASDTGGACVASGLSPSGVVDAILFRAGSSSNFTAGTINIYGVRRA